MHRRLITPLLLCMFMCLVGCTTDGLKTAFSSPREPFPSVLEFAGDFDTPPKFRFMPRTVFPPFLIEQHVSGSAKVTFLIGADGYVSKAVVVEATHPAFGANALGTACRMVFKPALLNGQPVAVQCTTVFKFEYE